MDLWGIGSSLQAVANVANGVMNMRNTDKTNKVNKDIARENLAYQREVQDYQKALQQTIFEREDTAHQREINDLKAAGINPLATASGGNGAGAGAVIPLTEMQNTYQEQQADLTPFTEAAGAIGQAVDREITINEAEKQRQWQESENQYSRSQQHAEFVMQMQQRQEEARDNTLQRMAELAERTDNDKLLYQLQQMQEQRARAEFGQQIKEYNENAGTRNEQERALKLANDQKEHDLTIDKRAGTKSNETIDSKATTAARIGAAAKNSISSAWTKTQKKLQGRLSYKDKRDAQDRAKALQTAKNQIDLLPDNEKKILDSIMTSKRWKTKSTLNDNQKEWQSYIDAHKKQNRSKLFMDTLEKLKKGRANY